MALYYAGQKVGGACYDGQKVNGFGGGTRLFGAGGGGHVAPADTPAPARSGTAQVGQVGEPILS